MILLFEDLHYFTLGLGEYVLSTCTIFLMTLCAHMSVLYKSH